MVFHCDHRFIGHLIDGIVYLITVDRIEGTCKTKKQYKTINQSTNSGNMVTVTCLQQQHGYDRYRRPKTIETLRISGHHYEYEEFKNNDHDEIKKHWTQNKSQNASYDSNFSNSPSDDRIEPLMAYLACRRPNRE